MKSRYPYVVKCKECGEEFRTDSLLVKKCDYCENGHPTHALYNVGKKEVENGVWDNAVRLIEDKETT